MTHVIISVLFIAVLFVGCMLIPAQPTNPKKAKELDRFADKYGGFYIFDKQFVDEIKQREMERKEYMDIFFKTHKLFTRDDLASLNKALPQTLSNGCKYYENEILFFQDKPKYTYYENKIKEYLGAENYNKLKPYMYVYSYYECSEKIYPLIISLNIQYDMVKYGLFGDEGRGFSIAKHYSVPAGTRKYSSTFYLINDRFVESKENENDK
ncbi:hypothetical protein [Helicobacter trogontum]|uniref:tRNA 2-selenouridine synthase n=2 Tax=Helicobacter trogontum TaxID=50960 RepID=A0A4U8TAV6_9HELI|nr:hypothetical protein [Helicobacter trogontum]TLD97030.1 hypothetical protein LS80_007730 [Helicobacter trogontum]